MEIILAMAKRKCRYAGEYGPECLAAMTEYEFSYNPAHIEDAIANGLESGEFVAVQKIVLTVDEKAIDAALFPNREPINADVLPNPSVLPPAAPAGREQRVVGILNRETNQGD